ncbi:TetR/AcrR family transcriptional regulator [Granulosicoccus antarcticus]|uniref:HTH-type transcriptional regulator RutR n=1 Tax=Granulosicoccus antarcticus IMCC3135 TaxID=1192854 RepID=A0A2Z2NUY1_9GAMM|nr:TetR/AcrR family transcriptional regulator [Granulosicoccus antarcticus]ASJ70914.1 HTH-type transcriptional regulator RutR [Granulosicoccus antarcticus IMCC3135]
MTSDQTYSQRKRAAILNAAAEEFRSNGYRETSMDRIAEVAQVSKRTVYKHFPSKDDLYRAITHELVLQEHYSIDGSYNQQQSLRSQLIHIATQEVAAFSSDTYLSNMRVLLGEAFRSPEIVQKVFQDLPVNGGAFFEWINAAMDDGRLQIEDPRLATQQLLSLLKGILFWPQAMSMQGAVSMKAQTTVIASAVDMFLDHYEVR